ncbi:hypothetical protein BKA62DRAFT_769784 [Auriculariales sp. MPI-PUGE-AT-0066]|nr:hypothetical protein BKA62DRAFT_769784 [Auriculariales sp. MPI-PUGE-AT-0066]
MEGSSRQERVILQIQQENGVDEESLRKAKSDPGLGATIANLQRIVTVTIELLSNELYTKPAHCCLELLQNADDNLYPPGVKPELHITLRQGYMEIKCNESTKKNQAGFIGEKGIGAKSIFKVAKRVTIQSKGYSFELNRDRLLGMITPYWRTDLGPDSGWTTMRLELIDDEQFSVLQSQLFEIRHTVLLFLRKLAKLTIDDGAIFSASKTLKGTLMQLETTISSAGGHRATTTIHRYLRVAQTIAIAEDADKRAGQKNTEIILAFPLNTKNEPISHPGQMVHAFLPLRSVGFRFLLQADFLTAANREDILVDRKWNIAIRDAVASAFVAAVDEFQAHPTLRLPWLLFLPRSNEVVHPFFTPVVTSIISKLKAMHIVWGSNDDYALPSLCKQAGKYISSDDGEPLIPSAHTHFTYVSSLYSSDVIPLLVVLGVKEMQYNDFLDGLEEIHRQYAFTARGLEWLEDVCDKILTYGTSRQRRNTALVNESHVRRLPLARRRNGSWSACESSQTSSFFFDRVTSSFPTGLDIEVLSHVGLGSRHQQVLRLLGVRDVDINVVVDKILAVHRSSTRLQDADILTHLQYLFQHRHTHRRPNLSTTIRLLDATSTTAHGSQLYMERPSTRASDINLDELLTYPARFIHSSLLLNRPPTSYDHEWRDWFHTALGVATSPRLTSSGQPSTEFLRLINSLRLTQPSHLLKLFKEFWTQMMSQLASFSSGSYSRQQFLGYMRQLEVTCTNGTVAPLSSTYLLCASLRSFETSDMLLLPVTDTTADWSFLRECGVTMDVSAALFLRRLRSLAGASTKPASLETLEEIYRQLESRFHDIPSEIHTAFAQEKLIFADGAWRPLNNFVWDGPSILTIKRKLKILYPHFKALFQKHLGVKDATDDVVADELRKFVGEHANNALNQPAIDRLRRLLAFGSDTVQHIETGKLADWTAGLRHSAIFPMRVPDAKEVRLASVGSAAFYVPDPTGVLAEIFANKVAFLDLDPGNVLRMQPLLARFGIDNRRIDKFVKDSVNIDEQSIELAVKNGRSNAQETAFYMHRLPLLERLYYYKTEKPLPVLRAEVVDVTSINVTYTLNGRPGDSISSTADCKVIVHDGTLVVFLTGSLDAHDRRNYPVAYAIIEALKMRNDDATVVRSILHDSERDVEHSLKYAGVHQMPEGLKQTFDLAAAEESDGDVENRVDDIFDHDTLSSPGSSANRGARKAKLRANQHSGDLRKYVNSDEGHHELQHLVICATQNSLHPVTQMVAPIITPPPPLNYQSNDNEPRATSSLDEYENIQAARVGYLGEHFVFSLLQNQLPNFSAANWTSPLRVHAGFESFIGSEDADFEYADEHSVLTRMLFPECVELFNATPHYLIEVKATSGSQSTPFTMSHRQLEHALHASQCQSAEPTPSRIYVLFRVSNIGVGRSPDYTILANPHDLLSRGILRISSAKVDLRISATNA